MQNNKVAFTSILPLKYCIIIKKCVSENKICAVVETILQKLQLVLRSHNFVIAERH
jgi:hypothetical protein